MTEMDFMPQWYRVNCRRKQSYQRRYLGLGLFFALFALWCFAAGRGVSKARAELNAMRQEFESGIQQVQRFRQLQAVLTDYQRKAAVLDSARPRTPYSAILAELSCCVGNNIVVQKLDVYAEAIDKKEKAGGNTSAMVRLGASDGAEGKSVSESPAQKRTCVVVQGIAASGQQVADLILALEQSDYFQQVYPNYSRNKQQSGKDVTEFEVRCVVADYELIL